MTTFMCRSRKSRGLIRTNRCTRGYNDHEGVGWTRQHEWSEPDWNSLYAVCVQTRSSQEQTGRPDAAQPLKPLSRTTMLGTFSSFPSVRALFKCSLNFRAHLGPRTYAWSILQLRKFHVILSYNPPFHVPSHFTLEYHHRTISQQEEQEQEIIDTKDLQ